MAKRRPAEVKDPAMTGRGKEVNRLKGQEVNGKRLKGKEIGNRSILKSWDPPETCSVLERRNREVFIVDQASRVESRRDEMFVEREEERHSPVGAEHETRFLD